MILSAGTLAQTSFAAVAVGLPAIAPALRSHYDLSLGQTGVVLGAVSLGMLPTLLAWGLLADRIPQIVRLGVGVRVRAEVPADPVAEALVSEPLLEHA